MIRRAGRRPERDRSLRSLAPGAESGAASAAPRAWTDGSEASPGRFAASKTRIGGAVPKLRPGAAKPRGACRADIDNRARAEPAPAGAEGDSAMPHDRRGPPASPASQGPSESATAAAATSARLKQRPRPLALGSRIRPAGPKHSKKSIRMHPIGPNGSRWRRY